MGGKESNSSRRQIPGKGGLCILPAENNPAITCSHFFVSFSFEKKRGRRRKEWNNRSLNLQVPPTGSQNWPHNKKWQKRSREVGQL